MKTHYVLEKMGWNDSLGGYSVAVARRGPLSLAQLRNRNRNRNRNHNHNHNHNHTHNGEINHAQ